MGIRLRGLARRETLGGGIHATENPTRFCAKLYSVGTWQRNGSRLADFRQVSSTLPPLVAESGLKRKTYS